MAFALTKFRAYGVLSDSPGRRAGVQYAELHITSTTSDVALDLGSDSGTFWTAALANATYDSLAAQAQEVLQAIDDEVVALTAVKSQSLISRPVGASASGTTYTLAVQNARPNITFASSNGINGAAVIVLEWPLKDSKLPRYADLGNAT